MPSLELAWLGLVFMLIGWVRPDEELSRGGLKRDVGDVAREVRATSIATGVEVVEEGRVVSGGGLLGLQRELKALCCPANGKGVPQNGINVVSAHLETRNNDAKNNVFTGKLVVAVAPQYFRAAKSYALAALSSLS
nr:hypothetical protein Iba_chr05eCG0810 [Ipomoea batatas]